MADSGNEAFRAALDERLADPFSHALLRFAEGRPLHLVGGAVRDAWLGQPSLDLDFVVAGAGETLSRQVAAATGGRWVRLGGERFAAFRVVDAGGERMMDLWDRGADSLEQDLARRDFTLNSIALDLATAELVDPFGGLADLGARRLRATTPEAFHGDALRVLRLARFAAELDDFTVEPETLDLARAAAPGLWSVGRARVAPERVRYELDRVLTSPQLDTGVGVLVATGVYPWLWDPAADPACGERLLADLDAFLERLADAFEAWPDLEIELDLGAGFGTWALAFAALPAEPPAVERVRAFRERGFLPRSEADAIACLLPLPELPAEDGRQRRRFLHRYQTLWPIAALLALPKEFEPSFKKSLAEVDRLARLAASDGDAIFRPSRLLTAAEVQELLGIAPGPLLGQALQSLAAAQVEGRVKDAFDARRYLLKWQEKQT